MKEMEIIMAPAGRQEHGLQEVAEFISWLLVRGRSYMGGWQEEWIFWTLLRAEASPGYAVRKIMHL